MKVLCIGLANYDITLPFDAFPIENSKNRLDNSIMCGGGPAANAGCLLSKYGIDVYFAGIVGKDLYGEKVKEDFKRFNVNIDYIEEKDNYDTSIGYIIVNKQNGSRTVMTVKKSGNLTLRDIDIKPDIILLDGQEEEFSKKMINDFKDATVILDAGTYKESNVNLAHLSDYIICSKDFLEGYVKKDLITKEDLIWAYQILDNDYNKILIVTLGENGCMYKENNTISFMPTLKVDAKDTTGAGDIFHGTFIYGLINNMSLKENLKLSCISSALSTRYLSGRNSIIDLKELKNYYEKCK